MGVGKENTMGGIFMTVNDLWMAFGVITAVLTVLVIYGNALSTREDDEIYLNQAEEIMMGSEQRTLVAKMKRLAGVIRILAAMSGLLLLAAATAWMWIGWCLAEI